MRSRDRGTTWEETSPDLTKAIDRDTMPIMGRVVTDETLSDNDGISSYGNITAFSESKHSPDALYVGTDDGNLQVTLDGGATWNNVIDQVPGVPSRTYVSRLETSHALDGRVYATFDGHRNDDYAPHAYVSEDHGASWRRITAGLPDGWSVNVIREHPRNPNLLFLGNEIGVYLSIDRGESWGRMQNNLPTVAVDDIAIHPRENDLVLGTHGRSIWILDDITPLEEMAADVFASDFRLFGARRGTMWSMGTDWPFQPATFIAPNPVAGIALRYYLGEGVDSDGASLEILDGGDGVRTMDASRGRPVLTRCVWDFRVDPAFEADGGRWWRRLPGRASGGRGSARAPGHLHGAPHGRGREPDGGHRRAARSAARGQPGGARGAAGRDDAGPCARRPRCATRGSGSAP